MSVSDNNIEPQLAVGLSPVRPSMQRRSHGARIKQQLLIDIRSGGLNSRLPPEIQLARRFGVNRLTVNKVMTELSREGYIRRIPGRGTFVTSPDKQIVTSNPTRQKLGQIVIAYPEYFSLDLWSKVNCAEEIAHHHELELINFKMSKATKYEALVALIKEKRSTIRGAIVVPPASTIDAKTTGLLNALNIPIVVLSACERPILGENVVAVYRDYYKEGHIAMGRLIEAGHRQIGYVFTEPWHLGSRLQYQGVKQALYDYGLNLKDLVRSPNAVESWENGMHAGYEYTRQMLKEHELTGIMYRSMVGAIGGLRAINEAGLSSPEDISITSAGEGGLLEEYLRPALSSVVVDYKVLLEVAFDVLLQKSHRYERQITVDVRMMERDSIRNITNGQNGAH